MSTYVDGNQLVVWIDGDAFRGPANGTEPALPFAAAPVSGAVTLLAFGAIKAGFTITPTQDKKEYDAWNNETGAVLLAVQGNTKTTIKFRCSQRSRAAELTNLRGGSVAETSVGSGVYRTTKGSGEELSLLLQLKGSDGGRREAFWIPRCKLATDPEKNKNDDDLDGYEFEFDALAPSGGGQAVVPLDNWNIIA